MRKNQSKQRNRNGSSSPPVRLQYTHPTAAAVCCGGHLQRLVPGQFAVLNVTAESASTSTTVRILNNEETPLTLSAPASSNPAFAVELRTNQPGKEFQLIIKTVPSLPPGNAQGQVSMKTSSTNMPVINVSVWANVQPVITVMPPQIGLGAAPLANATAAVVSIRSNGTNTLALSEPAVNAKGVDMQLKEVEAGRSFTLALNFPAGFEIAQGERVEVSLRSSHPQFPSIRVPVVQAAPPGAAGHALGHACGAADCETVGLRKAARR